LGWNPAADSGGKHQGYSAGSFKWIRTEIQTKKKERTQIGKGSNQQFPFGEGTQSKKGKDTDAWRR